MHAGYDVSGFCQRFAWAGVKSFPYGLIGCKGWIPHARQLSNVVAALNRRPGAASQIRLISIVPYSQGEYCLIRFRRDGRPDAFEQRFQSALFKAQERCLTSCQVCGGFALPVIAGGVFCHKHAPSRFAFEALADVRQIRRRRRGWCKASRATILGYSKDHVQGACMVTYSLQGRHYLRSHDAPPGSRQQVFEYLVESGLAPEDICGEWAFPVTGLRTRK